MLTSLVYLFFKSFYKYSVIIYIQWTWDFNEMESFSLACSSLGRYSGLWEPTSCYWYYRCTLLAASAAQFHNDILDYLLEEKKKASLCDIWKFEDSIYVTEGEKLLVRWWRKAVDFSHARANTCQSCMLSLYSLLYISNSSWGCTHLSLSAWIY